MFDDQQPQSGNAPAANHTPDNLPVGGPAAAPPPKNSPGAGMPAPATPSTPAPNAQPVPSTPVSMEEKKPQNEGMAPAPPASPPEQNTVPSAQPAPKMATPQEANSEQGTPVPAGELPNATPQAAPTIPHPPTTAQPKTMPAPPRNASMGPLKIIATAFVIIALIGVALFIAYTLLVQQPFAGDDGDVVQSVPEEDVIENGDVVAPEEEDNTDPEEEAVEDVDSDGDGLTDAEEAREGTDPRNQDSDRDGLGDREEVKTYGTDPLDADTDNDGFLDGSEVVNGYNPNGSGKLFEVPTK